MTLWKRLFTGPLLLLMLSFSFWAFAPSCARAAATTGSETAIKQEAEKPLSPDLGYTVIKDTLPESIFDLTDGSDDFLSQILTIAMPVVSLILATLLIASLIYSGILYITAGGDPEKAKKARQNIGWALTGLLVLLLSIFALALIRKIIGTDVLNLPAGGS